MNPLLKQLEAGQHLSQAEAQEMFATMLAGGYDEQTVTSILLSLKAKGETVDEITGAAQAMRAAMQPFSAPEDAMDVCGTGGDAKGTYNISSTVAIVLASCGIPVVKHGNRAVSSQSGSTDVLAELGIAMTDDTQQLARSLEQSGICYLPAPLFHPALKIIQPVRKKLQTRTIFNLLGPLCNPAKPARQLMGVYAPELTKTIALVLQQLGSKAVAVVHGCDGLDELTVTGTSQISQLLEGDIYSYEIEPKMAGLDTYMMQALIGGDAKANAKALLELLDGKQGGYRDAVLLNTAAALIVAERVDELATGVALAAEAIDSGRAKQTLAKWQQSSQ